MYAIRSYYGAERTVFDPVHAPFGQRQQTIGGASALNRGDRSFTDEAPHPGDLFSYNFV